MLFASLCRHEVNLHRSRGILVTIPVSVLSRPRTLSVVRESQCSSPLGFLEGHPEVFLIAQFFLFDCRSTDFSPCSFHPLFESFRPDIPVENVTDDPLLKSILEFLDDAKVSPGPSDLSWTFLKLCNVQVDVLVLHYQFGKF